MELNKMKRNEDSEINTDKEFDIKNIEDIYKRKLEIGKYIFRIKPNIKGKELFMLTNTFGITVENATSQKSKIKSINEIFKTFGDNYDLALSYFEYSINGVDFLPLVINEICQVPEVETNVAIIYQLFVHLQMAAVLFMEISQQQLSAME